MTESSATTAADRPNAEENYQPISGLAIAGVVASGLFALLVTIFGIRGLLSGMPFFMLSWLYMLPASGLILSLLAKWQIRNAEGTRAGLALTSCGIWLSILFGLGYLSYEFTTNFTVRRQAETFLLDSDKGFIAKLRTRGQVWEAFKLTRPPEMRPSKEEDEAARLDSMKKGELIRFQNMIFIRVLQQSGPDAEVEVQSIRKCDYREGGYWVEFILNVKTPDEELQMPVTVRSVDTEGSEREWYLDVTKLPDHPMAGGLTDHGKKMAKTRVECHRFASKWLGMVVSGDIADALKQTLHPEDFAVGGKGYINLGKKIPSEAIRLEIQSLLDETAKRRPTIETTLVCCEPDSGMRRRENPAMAMYDLDAKTGRLQIRHEFWLGVPTTDKDRLAAAFKFTCAAQLIVEKKGSGWKVVGIEFTDVFERARALVPSKMPPPPSMEGGRGGPGGPGGGMPPR